MKSISKMNKKLIAIQKTNIEYELFPLQFFLLTIWGMWHPKDWPAKIKRISGFIFISVFFIDTIMCIEMSINLILTFGTNDFKMFNIFFTSSSIVAMYKAIKIIQIREKLRTLLLNYFESERLHSSNIEEHFILENRQIQIRKVTIIYFSSMAAIFTVNAIGPVLSQPENKMQLPVHAWYPYSLQKSYRFWITYFHQVILCNSLICAHIGIDTLFVGLLLTLSCQIDILKYRLQNVTTVCSKNCKNLECLNTTRRKLIFQCIYQQNKIYKFGEDINNQFQAILFTQILQSIPNICINVYSISKYSGDINKDYISTFFNTISSLLQLFITCWYGNELLLNSLQVKNSIYEMNWTIFDVSTKKLLVIMATALRPIKFSVAYIIPMNLESFIKIIKASYSAFNLLQQT